MNPIQFTTVVSPDGVIHPPDGIKLPEGEIDVSVRPRSTFILDSRRASGNSARSAAWILMTSWK